MGLFDRIAAFFKGGSERTCAPQIKPGRNEPCWCGSGMKYKKCHLSGDEEKAAERAYSMNCGPT